MARTDKLQPTSQGEIGKNSAIRKSDLSTRERVNFVVSSTIMEELRARSAKDQVPMSRIIDAALMSYLNNSSSLSNPFVSPSWESGIILYHLLELVLTVKCESLPAKNVMNCIQTHFEHFAFSSCLIKKSHDNLPIIGTKIILFMSDNQNKNFLSFIDDMSELEEKQSIEVFLDGKLIDV